jgi:rhodanese-related sulfurtransferase
MDLQFVVQNWPLFLALVVIVAMLALDPILRRSSGAMSVSAAELPRLINHESAVVVDVGEPGEFRSGHIPDAINLPLNQLADNLKRLEKYRNKKVPIVLSCRTGNRSTRAATILRRNQFEKVYTLSGGVAAWDKENFPIQRD